MCKNTYRSAMRSVARSRLSKISEKRTIFVLRREPLYHKLQYSKSPKFDAAAAAFGVTIGAFGVYLALSSLGSMGADLSDLSTFCWYVGLWFCIGTCCLNLCRSSVVGVRRGLPV